MLKCFRWTLSSSVQGASQILTGEFGSFDCYRCIQQTVCFSYLGGSTREPRWRLIASTAHQCLCSHWHLSLILLQTTWCQSEDIAQAHFNLVFVLHLWLSRTRAHFLIGMGEVIKSRGFNQLMKPCWKYKWMLKSPCSKVKLPHSHWPRLWLLTLNHK